MSTRRWDGSSRGGWTMGRMEFGFRVAGGDELLPHLRFVPAVTSGGWLRSSELSFSVCSA